VPSNLEWSRKKVVGEPDEGKPHVRFNVAGDGNQGVSPQAPSLDPTSRLVGFVPTFKHFSGFKFFLVLEFYLIPPTSG